MVTQSGCHSTPGPCIDSSVDDGGRGWTTRNFIGIQHSHGIASVGSRCQAIRTGEEQSLAHRVDDLWATAAEQDGEVVQVSAKGIKVRYVDGSVKAVELGRRFGTSAGSVYPNTLVTRFKVGDKVSKGDIIAYNQDFFEPNALNPKQVAYKTGVIAKTALLESQYTLEDSCGISLGLMKALTTHTTKVEDIVVPFYKEIRNLVTVGERVEHGSILCVMEDPVTAQSNYFDDESATETLRLLNATTRTVSVSGIVESVEVFYHGDMEDMTESLQQICAEGDRQRRRDARAAGKTEVTGSVDQSLRINGDGLDLDHVVIRVKISSAVEMGIGDKAVFCNQMKTIVGYILTGKNQTASGVDIDAIFGYKSLKDRIVLSALVIGMINALMRTIGERAAREYLEVV